MEDRPGTSQQASNGEGRSLTSLNPFARAAALAAQAAGSPAAATAATPPTANPDASSPTPVAEPGDASTTTPAMPTTHPSLGKLAHVDATRLWADAAAFATWLADNLDALGDALFVRLRDGRVPSAEAPVVTATDAWGATAVMVCELGEASDEGFGRLVRNVAATKAKHAVWICSDPGEEYGASVSWLNRAVDARVSMVKVSAVTIGDSAAAPMFEVRVRSPREDDSGMQARVPGSDAVDSAPATRRVEDWLEDAGVGDESS